MDEFQHKHHIHIDKHHEHDDHHNFDHNDEHKQQPTPEEERLRMIHLRSWVKAWRKMGTGLPEDWDGLGIVICVDHRYQLIELVRNLGQPGSIITDSVL